MNAASFLNNTVKATIPTITPTHYDPETALCQNKELSRHIISSSHDCIKLFDLEGRLLFISDGGCRALNIADPAPYLGKDWVGFFESELRSAARFAVTEAAAGRIGYFQGEICMPGGKASYWDAVISPILGSDGKPTQLLAVSREITELKRIQKALEESEQLHRTLSESMQNQNNRLALLSKAAGYLFTTNDPERMVIVLFEMVAKHLALDGYFNYDLSEEEGTLRLDSCAGISEEAALALARLEIGQAICGSVASTCQPMTVTHIQESDAPQVALIRSLGFRAYVCAPLIIGDRLIGTLSFGTRNRDSYSEDDVQFLRTISHYVAIAKGRLRVDRDLRSALEKAEAANIAKTQFLTNMSHELRTPMNAVIGIGHILALQNFTPAQKEFIHVLQESASSLMHVINDMLDIAKIESSIMEVQHIPFSLNEEVAKILAITSVTAKEKGLALNLNIAGKLPEYFIGDPFRISQIILNLVSNAIKFTEHGSVTITLESGKIQPDNRLEVTIRVTDTGIGIEEALLQVIFEKFTQADSSITRKYGGSGLGLTISRELAQIMDGNISVESTIRQGSNFIFRIPLLVV